MATGNIGVNNQWWNIHTGAVQIAQNVTLSNYPGYTSANSSPQWRVSMSKKVTFWSQVHPASFKPFSPTLAASQTKLGATTSATSAQVSQNNTRKNSKKLNIFSLWQGRLFQYFFPGKVVCWERQAGQLVNWWRALSGQEQRGTGSDSFVFNILWNVPIRGRMCRHEMCRDISKTLPNDW